jgi:hypothetical protein
MTEKSYRDELLSSQKLLTLDRKGLRIMAALRVLYPEMSSAYILKHIPDQSEDFYEIMVDGKSIVSVEADRLNIDAELIVAELDFNSYRSDLSKTNRIKFMVAVDLANQS